MIEFEPDLQHPLEQAVIVVASRGRWPAEDVDAARVAARAQCCVCGNRDFEREARLYLNAARAVRIEGGEVNTSTVIEKMLQLETGLSPQRYALAREAWRAEAKRQLDEELAKFEAQEEP